MAGWDRLRGGKTKQHRIGPPVLENRLRRWARQAKHDDPVAGTIKPGEEPYIDGHTGVRPGAAGMGVRTLIGMGMAFAHRSKTNVQVIMQSFGEVVVKQWAQPREGQPQQCQG